MIRRPPFFFNVTATTEIYTLSLHDALPNIAKLAEMNLDACTIVTETGDENLYLSARNLRKVAVTDVAGVSPVDLVGSEKVLMTVGAVRAIEEWLS